MLSTPTGDAYAINKVLTSHVNRVLPGYSTRLLLITPITQSKEKPQQAPRNTFEIHFPRFSWCVWCDQNPLRMNRSHLIGIQIPLCFYFIHTVRVHRLVFKCRRALHGVSISQQLTDLRWTFLTVPSTTIVAPLTASIQ